MPKASKKNNKPEEPREKPQEQPEEIAADLADDFSIAAPPAPSPPSPTKALSSEEQKVLKLAEMLGITKLAALVTENAKQVDGLIRDFAETKNAVITNAQTLQQVVQFINTGKVQPAQQGQIQTEGSQEEKILALTELAKGFAEAYNAVKRTPQDGNQFQSMMADWGARMFQYHLDNMAQSVYNIKLPPPSHVLQGARIPLTTQPQEEQHGFG